MKHHDAFRGKNVDARCAYCALHVSAFTVQLLFFSSFKPEAAPSVPSAEDESARGERDEAERELREAETIYADCKAVEEKVSGELCQVYG